MDTKLKKYPKIKFFIIGLIILIPSLVMMFLRPYLIRTQEEENTFPYSYSSISSYLVNAAYVLHAEEVQRQNNTTLHPYDIFFATDEDSKKKESSEHLDDVKYSIDSDFDEWNNSFSHMRSYLEYDVLDQNRKVIDTNRTRKDGALYNASKLSYLGGNENYNPYAFIAMIEYDENGNILSTSFVTDKPSNASQVLNELAKKNPTEYYAENYDFHQTFQNPKNRIFCFGMTNDSFQKFNMEYSGFFQETYSTQYYMQNRELLIVFLFLLVFVSLAALLLPHVKALETGKEHIFQVPFEFVAIAGYIVYVVGYIASTDLHTFHTQTIRSLLNTLNMPHTFIQIIQYLIELFGWYLVFTFWYWIVSCLREVFVLGPKTYWRTRVITYRIWPWARKLAQDFYKNLLHVNLTGNIRRILFKVILLNFIILSLISMMWFFGIGALILYSLVLLYLLQKYIKKIQEQYELLLRTTNELAKGNLNANIPEDLGVFEPFREEIDKIQHGFKKAVDEEVKSTKMKTDLITNVSHDLKTPLTAIITYVDLLKKEGLSQEEQKKYIDILDQKANRLKILIEDLFEVSKATSKSINLNIVDVDIVSLLKQVKLELQDKIDATDLIFRWQLPEEKIILPLDSQRTYRVFENLIVNITKYAMPHTRAYITMENMEDSIRITMKNVSENELNFNTEDLTERFVRGDVSRNTEGSGLGLAIAKSFTELQGGHLNLFTDADLFTVEITFLK